MSAALTTDRRQLVALTQLRVRLQQHGVFSHHHTDARVPDIVTAQAAPPDTNPRRTLGGGERRWTTTAADNSPVGAEGLEPPASSL